MAELKKLVSISIILSTCVLLASLTGKSKTAADTEQVRRYWAAYLDSLSSWEQEITTLAVNGDEAEISAAFLHGRALYKHVEFLTEYYFPVSANKINGAPILEAEASQNLEPIYPTGFQVLEPYVYGRIGKEERDQIRFEASNIGNAIRKIRNRLPDVEMTPSSLLDAFKLGIYSMMIKGLAGFDAPEARSGINECHYVLDGGLALARSLPASDSLVAAIRNCDRFVTQNYTDFNSFNRALFIKDYCNALTRSIVSYQLREDIPFVRSLRAVNPRAATIFAPDAFDPVFFAPDGTVTSGAMAALGQQLFMIPGCRAITAGVAPPAIYRIKPLPIKWQRMKVSPEDCSCYGIRLL